MKTLILGTIAASLLSVSAASAEPAWRVLTQFDDAPEGLVSDGKDGLFVSLYHSGRVMHVGKDGKATEIANLRSVIGDAEGSTVGLDWDKADSIYVAFAEYSKKFAWPHNPTWAVEAFKVVEQSVRGSMARLRRSPFIPHTDKIRGFVYDVHTGELREVDAAETQAA